MNSIDLNGFAVEIIGSNGPVNKLYDMGHTYFSMPHGTEYKLRLSTSRNTRSDAHVWIDGEKVGVWRLNPYDSITIERPANIARKFTLLAEGTNDAINANIVTGANENGLVKVVFKPEFREWSYPLCSDGLYSATNQCISTNSTKQLYSYPQKQSFGIESAGTALGDRSNQTFGHASRLISIDENNVTTIYARLVVDNGPKYTSLKSIRHMSDIPPRISTELPPKIDTTRRWYDIFW